MQEVITFAELHGALLDAGKFVPSAELHILRPGPFKAYQRLKTADQIPAGKLILKVVAPPPGVYSVVLAEGLGLLTKPLVVQH